MARGRVIAFGATRAGSRCQAQIHQHRRDAALFQGHQLYNFATARAAAIKAGTIIVAEGYMDVIALVRAGFAHAWRPWAPRSPKTSCSFFGAPRRNRFSPSTAMPPALKAAHRAARLALPHLKPGYSLRFAFLPAGEDPDSS